MRVIIESEWPEIAHKRPPIPRGWNSVTSYDVRLAPSVVMSPRAGHLKSSARPVVGMTASPVLNTRAAGSEVRGNFSVGPPSKTFSAPTLGVVSGSTGPAFGLVVSPSLPFLVCTS
jgi:hypothetical protein